jgi:hypothetical protein
MQLHEKLGARLVLAEMQLARILLAAVTALGGTLVKYTLGLVLSVICFSLPMLAIKNSQGFLLPTDVRIGDIQIPRGPCNVTWTEPSGSQVQLIIKTEGRNPITLPARMVEVKHSKSGITTFVDNGVTYIQDFHTADHTFILIGTPGAKK